MWRAVPVMRAVDSFLKDGQANTEARDRLIAIHGNLLDEQKTDVAQEMGTLPDIAKGILSKVIHQDA
jgi:hypothetical protein